MSEQMMDVEKATFISGPVITFKPIIAEMLGINDAMVFTQLLYRSESSNLKVGETTVVRFSYTKIQKQIPFFTKRTIINIISRLEARKTIFVLRTKRVNEIAIMGAAVCEYIKANLTEKNVSPMVVYPQLAKLIGLNEAIIIQQIHIRHFNDIPGYWVIRPYHVWQSDVLMFMSIGAIKRAFAKLKALNLIYVKAYTSDYAVTNAYRVNYLKLAEILQLPISPPKIVDEKGWVNPLYPKLKNIK